MRGRSRVLLPVVAVVAAVLLARATGVAPGGMALFGDRSAVGVAQDRSASDLVVPPQPATGVGNWAFTEKAPDGRPVAYDPCRTIRYQIRIGSGPVNGQALVTDAVARLSAATGLRFEFVGFTDRVPRSDEDLDIDDPVWIGWATAEETDLYTRVGLDAVGVGGSSYVETRNGTRQYVTGYAMVRPGSGLLPGFAPGRSEGSVLLHELGHVVGLDHVSNPTEIMYPGVSPQSPESYGPGDLQGLWALGASRGCS